LHPKHTNKIYQSYIDAEIEADSFALSLLHEIDLDYPAENMYINNKAARKMIRDMVKHFKNMETT
jgi:hypothetical protein